MWFNLLWCMLSTFTPFSKIETYLDTILVSLFLLLPLVCFRAVKTTLVIFFLLDGLLISNLMYFRTYFTAIPLDSYLLIDNLSDFTSSVFDSWRMVDLFSLCLQWQWVFCGGVIFIGNMKWNRLYGVKAVLLLPVIWF